MKVFKTVAAIIFSLPILYMPIGYVLDGSKSKDKAEVVLESRAEVFGDQVWMTSSFKKSENDQVKGLFTYDEVDAVKPEGWKVPTYEQAVQWLNELGFDQEPGIVDSDYYKVNWEYLGYEDPIVGESGKGQKDLFWIKGNTKYNYIVINKDELTFKAAKTLETARLSLRLIR